MNFCYVTYNRFVFNKEFSILSLKQSNRNKLQNLVLDMNTKFFSNDIKLNDLSIFDCMCAKFFELTTIEEEKYFGFIMNEYQYKKNIIQMNKVMYKNFIYLGKKPVESIINDLYITKHKSFLKEV